MITSSDSLFEVFDLLADGNGTTKFVRRGTSTGTNDKNFSKGETQ